MLWLNDPAPAIESYHWLASLGVGGVLAGIVFHFYRQDRKSSEERCSQDRKLSEERYAALAMDFRTIVQDNTAAMTKLCELLDGQERVK